MAADQKLEETSRRNPYTFASLRRDVMLVTGSRLIADKAAANFAAQEARHRLGI